MNFALAAHPSLTRTWPSSLSHEINVRYLSHQHQRLDFLLDKKTKKLTANIHILERFHSVLNGSSGACCIPTHGVVVVVAELSVTWPGLLTLGLQELAKFACNT